MEFRSGAATFADADPRQRNVAWILEQRSAERPDHDFLSVGDVSRTYAEMEDIVARLASRLREEGIGRGDRVGFMIGNRIELFEGFLACTWIGAIFVPFNTAWRGGQLVHALENAAPRFVVAEAKFLEPLLHDNVRPALPRVVVVDDPADQPAAAGFERFGPGSGRTDRVDLRPDEPVAIMYTSGTTGPSKGVTCPVSQFHWWGMTMCETLSITDDDVLYNCLPLFHINALVAPVQAMVAGGACVIGTRFSASQFWLRAKEARATVAYLLGGIAGMLLAQPPGKADRDHSLRVILSPGIPAASWPEFTDRFGVRIAESYGMTECNHCIGQTDRGSLSVASRMGFLLEDLFEARVVDDLDFEVAAGAPGELVLRSKVPHSFCLGYWGMPEATIQLFRNQWLHTGDQVIRHSDGRYEFVGRIKDAIRRFGENVSSWEVEQALATHPSVSESAVYAVSSDMGDEEVMAAIVLRPGAEPHPLGIVRHLEDNLAYFAIPRYIDFVDELPHTPNGKVIKGPLREQGVTAGAWDRVAAGHELKRIR